MDEFEDETVKVGRIGMALAVVVEVDTDDDDEEEDPDPFLGNAPGTVDCWDSVDVSITASNPCFRRNTSRVVARCRNWDVSKW